MIELREVLVAHADEAPSYDVADAVLRGARRRRRIRQVLPAVAVVAALAVALPTVISAVTGLTVPVVAADRSVTPGTIPWLPEKLDAGTGTPAPLPTDRPVGLGALVWLPCDGQCAPRLVTSAGAQYALPMYGDGTSERTALSPDGKWLSYRNPDGSSTLRDLSGTRTVALADRQVLAWSTDSRRVAVAKEVGRGPMQVLSLPTADGTELTLPSGEQRPLAGLTTSGDAVFGANTIGEVGGPVTLRVTEHNGISRLIDATADGEPWRGEELTFRAVLESDGGRVLLQELSITDDVGKPADLLRVDLSDGTVLGRIRLPEPKPGSQPRVLPDGSEAGGSGGESRGLIAAGPGGALLAHVVGARTMAVESLDVSTGARRVVCAITNGAIWITIRGETAF